MVDEKRPTRATLDRSSWLLSFICDNNFCNNSRRAFVKKKPFTPLCRPLSLTPPKTIRLVSPWLSRHGREKKKFHALHKHQRSSSPEWYTMAIFWYGWAVECKAYFRRLSLGCCLGRVDAIREELFSSLRPATPKINTSDSAKCLRTTKENLIYAHMLCVMGRAKQREKNFPANGKILSSSSVKKMLWGEQKLHDVCTSTAKEIQWKSWWECG